jgi:hypothetical protein
MRLVVPAVNATALTQHAAFHGISMTVKYSPESPRVSADGCGAARIGRGRELDRQTLALGDAALGRAASE